MAARTFATPRRLWMALVWYVALASIAAALSAPKQLSGFVLDAQLGVTQESIPGDAVRPGDAVVAVAGRPVDSADTLAAALRASGESAEVVVEQRGRRSEVTLTPGRLDGPVPDELAEALVILQVDGETLSGELSVDELRARAERASPEPIVVTVERAPNRVSAPVAVERTRPPALAIAWLAMTFLLLLAVLVMRSERVDRSGQAPGAALAAVGAGGIAAFGLSVLALSPSGTTRLLAFTSSAAVAAQGFVSLRAFAAATQGRVSSWLIVVAVSIVAGAAPLAVSDPAGTSWWVVAAFIASLAASRAIVVQDAPLWARAADGASALAAAGALAAAAADLPLSNVAGLLAAGVALTWARSVPESLSLGDAPVRGAYVADARLIDALRALSADVQDADAALLVGADAAWIELRAGRDDERPQIRRAEDAWSAAMGMLAVEGGAVPRAATPDDDPFGDWPEKLGIVAALPVHASGDALAAFVVVREPEGADAPASAVQHALDAVPAFEAARPEWLAAAAAGLASGPPHGGLGAASDDAPPSGSGAPAPAPRVEERIVHVRDPSLDARLALLERELSLAHPVDDPEALTDRERSALRFLAVDAEPALLVGEPQVGKAFLARAVHALSPRSEEAFVTFDVGTTPRALVLPLLVGDEDEPGLLDAAADGTLLLKSAGLLDADELAEVLASVAASGVRVVFAERYVGDEEGVPASIPASIRDAVGPRNLHVRPLRERPADIRRFALWYAHRAAMGLGHERVAFSEGAYEALADWPWEGNFDELRAIVRRAVLRAGGAIIDVPHLALSVRSPSPEPATPPGHAATTASAPALSAAEERERDTIQRVLAKHEGNRTRAAKELGITRGKLLRRLKKFGLD